MKKITIGIIAHVDSGKTTLSEALLFLSGSIRSFGRVDKGASFLDNDDLERRRGITIFSKQARFEYGNTSFVLIDTPGHADFSAETERTLGILDYAILLIGADDGIKGQTKILWKLLEEYHVPLFLFFNKMDRDGSDKDALLSSARELSNDGIIDFSEKIPSDEFYEQIAMCTEGAMEEYLENGSVSRETVRELIRERKLFPCLFGSALLRQGVDELLSLLDQYTEEKEYPSAFSAKVYKVARDNDGVRQTFIKVTGGSLANKTLLPDGEKESKVNQLRFYSGEKYELHEEAFAGEVCVLTGLKESYAGAEYLLENDKIILKDTGTSILTPVLNYRVLTDQKNDPVKILPVFRQLEEESPELSVEWDEEKKEIYVSVMGLVQLEILSTILKERFSLEVGFDTGNVLYKETIAEPVIGVGHFEPLRHYAEVHLLLEPGERGSGLVFTSSLSSDRLAKNWQRLILTHLKERTHKGVLTGSPITDMKITLVAGKAHLKHTEGGDFRQATYRAVRQGLMMAENILLEPFYRFTLEVPTNNVGKALNDLDMIKADFTAPEMNAEKGVSVISGRGPVSALKDYPAEIASYTKGLGSISFLPDGYGLCHNAEEVIAEKGYDPLSDLRNTPDSVFCRNGAGHVVPYDEVYESMHLSFDGTENSESDLELRSKAAAADARTVSKTALGTEEVNTIIHTISHANTGAKKPGTKWKKKFGSEESAPSVQIGGKTVKISGLNSAFALEEADITLVDGYNVIFAWEDLNTLAKQNIDAARDSLIETLSKYRSIVNGEVIAVFDAYRVPGRPGEMTDYQGIKLVYTEQDQTADQYIERFVNLLNDARKSRMPEKMQQIEAVKKMTSANTGKLKIAVVTSDATEQVIARGQGCKLISSREFRIRIGEIERKLKEKYQIN